MRAGGEDEMKKSNRKNVLMVLAIVLAAILCACGSSEKDNGGEKGENQKEVKEEKKASGPSIEEEVLFEKDGVKVSVKGVEYMGTPADSAKVTFLVENQSTENLIFTDEAESVNQYDTGHVSAAGEKVPAGKQLDISMYISAEELEELGYTVNEIGEVGIKLAAWNENNEFLWDTGLLCVKTSEYGKTGEGTVEAGTEIYNAEGVRIEYLGMTEDEAGHPSAELLFENTSDKDVICDIGSDFSAEADVKTYEEAKAAMEEQIMAVPSSTPTVLSGKKRIEQVMFSYYDVEKKIDPELLNEVNISIRLTENVTGNMMENQVLAESQTIVLQIK